MKATIRKQRGISFSDKCVVYVDDGLSSLIDREYFSKHGVYQASFKSKAWTKVKNAVSKLIAESLRQVFVDDYKISFSSKAGCKCGCSPGYVVKRHGTYEQRSLEYKDVWVNVEVSAEELEAFDSKWRPIFEKEYAKEVEQEKEKVQNFTLA